MAKAIEIDDLVCVGWCDAVTYAGWRASDENRIPPTICLSYGIVRGLAVDGSMDIYIIGEVNNLDNVGRTMTIPHDWIMDIEFIRKEGQRMKDKIEKIAKRMALAKKKSNAPAKTAKKPAKKPKKSLKK